MTVLPDSREKPRFDKDGTAQPTRLLRNMATEGASTSSLLPQISIIQVDLAKVA